MVRSLSLYQNHETCNPLSLGILNKANSTALCRLTQIVLNIGRKVATELHRAWLLLIDVNLNAPCANIFF